MEAERPSTSRMASADAWKEDSATAAPWPPAQLNIRGSSGPPTVVVSNLMLGTTAEDVRMTFEQFGKVLEVFQRPPPSQNYPSVAFEVSFQEKEDAFQSIDKFDGALADGRILGVRFKSTVGDPKTAGQELLQKQLNSADLERRGGAPEKELIPSPGPLPRDAAAYNNHGRDRSSARSYTSPVPPAQHQNFHAPPSGPRSSFQKQPQHHQHPNAGRAGNQSNGKGKAPMIPTAPKAAVKPPPVSSKPLAARLLTPEQAKKQAQLEANKKRKAQAQAQALLWAKQKAGNKALVGGKKIGKIANVKGLNANLSLKDRLGSVPLAQRLAADSQKSGSKSDAATTEAEKQKKAEKAARLKAKRAAKKAEKKNANGGDGMEVDA